MSRMAVVSSVLFTDSLNYSKTKVHKPPTNFIMSAVKVANLATVDRLVSILIEVGLCNVLRLLRGKVRE